MNKPKSVIIEIVETLIVSYIVLMVVFKLVAFPEQVVGASMEPTLHTGDRILVQRLSKHFRDFNRGEIVVLEPPGLDGTHYVKRVIGMPGDIVKISDCFVTISNNGIKYELDEHYLEKTECTDGGKMIVEGRAMRLGNDEYMVLGDNRSNSADSRAFGPIARERIQGSVAFRFWPPSDFGFFDKKSQNK